MKRDLNDLSAEVYGIAMIVTGLSNQLDNNQTDVLTTESMQSALFGISNYLQRISCDLGEIS